MLVLPKCSTLHFQPRWSPDTPHLCLSHEPMSHPICPDKLDKAIQLLWHFRMTPRAVLSSSCFCTHTYCFLFPGLFALWTLLDLEYTSFLISFTSDSFIALAPYFDAPRSYAHNQGLYQATISIKDTPIHRPCLFRYYRTSFLGLFLITVNRPPPSWPPSPHISTSASPLLSPQSPPFLGPSA